MSCSGTSAEKRRVAAVARNEWLVKNPSNAQSLHIFFANVFFPIRICPYHCSSDGLGSARKYRASHFVELAGLKHTQAYTLCNLKAKKT
jgi:hypothetical protein